MKKDVAIVGGGVGGLATALQLLSKGYRVSIYEKNEKIGGKVNKLEKGGYTFDTTASILMMPQIFRDIFWDANRKLEDYVEMEQLHEYYRLFSQENKLCDFSSDLPTLMKTLESFSIADAEGYLAFLNDTYAKYQKAEKDFLNRSFMYKSQVINPKTLLKGLSLFPFTTAYKYISSFVKDEYLRQFLAFQSLYIGISPFNGPNIYTFIPLVTETYGLWYIKGGMYRYIEALQNAILEYGGEIYTSEEVQKIIIENNVAKGIIIDGKRIDADVVVCNSDFPYAINTLFEEDKIGKSLKHKIHKWKYSCSTFILYLGVKKKFHSLAVHNIILGDKFAENVEDIFRDKLPEDPPLYVYCPTRIDCSLAPPECESIHITVRVPNVVSTRIKWEKETVLQMREMILEKMEKVEGLKGIRSEIVTEDYLTPVDMLEKYGAYGGAAFGLSPTLSQTNAFRPQVKIPSIEGLYFVGSSVHPGTGISLVLRSSQLAVKEILKDEQKG